MGLSSAAPQDHLSFSIARHAIHKRILIPKYYDPDLATACKEAEETYELPRLEDLLQPGRAGSRLGVWIQREHYGTGPVPYVRTSDFNNWRVRPDFKKAVSHEVYEKVAARVDVCADDILMVAHGTYLVGTVAVVTEGDLPLVLQDHVFRLRLKDILPVSSPETADRWLVLAALSTNFVRRQVRARQFSADIIDKIGERHLEIRVPIPRDPAIRLEISKQVQAVVKGQTEVRKAVSSLLGSDLRMTRERAASRHGFTVPRANINRRILIPKYYDPLLHSDIAQEEQKWGKWVTLRELVDAKQLSVNTGVEVGKMAYGTGSIPFIRTTDIAELEVKASPRQGISQAIFDRYAAKAALAAGDVLVVRDGTYLVGSSAIAAEDDLPALICGGIYRLRSTDRKKLDPFTLLGLLNLPIVRREMRSKQFTRDVIDTLGKRLFEVKIPDPSSHEATKLGVELSKCMARKTGFRTGLLNAVRAVEPMVTTVSRSRPGWSMR
jgi:hypothetical protein